MNSFAIFIHKMCINLYCTKHCFKLVLVDGNLESFFSSLFSFTCVKAAAENYYSSLIGAFHTKNQPFLAISKQGFTF